jgi:hypothetical protein
MGLKGYRLWVMCYGSTWIQRAEPHHDVHGRERLGRLRGALRGGVRLALAVTCDIR